MTSEFYFDLLSPYAYLTAERVHQVIPGPIVWKPILLGALFKRFGHSSWAGTEEKSSHIEEIQRRAKKYGLPALKWPSTWPASSLMAMRMAIHAAEVGRVKEFALEAFRQNFVLEKDISLPENVKEAAIRAGLDLSVALERIQSEEIKTRLKEESDRAGDLGVEGVPTIVVGEKVFFGDDQLELAAEYCAGI